MKTRSLVLAALVAMGTWASAAHNDSTNTGLVVISRDAGHYKLIFKGEKPASQLTIVNSGGKVVYQESIHGLKGFNRPVNFNGMDADTYTFVVKGGGATLKTSVEYSPEKAKEKVVVKSMDSSKVAIIVPGVGEETIKVKIYDAYMNLIKVHQEKVNGSFGKIFNLGNVYSYEYTFEVSNSKGLIDTVTF